MKRRSEEKLRQAKARSYCAACKRRGHWHKDPECPLRGKTGSSTSKESAGGHSGGGLHQAQFCCNRIYLTDQAQDVDLRCKSAEQVDEHPIRDPVEEILSNGELQLVYMAGDNSEDGLWTRGGNPAKMQAIVDTACTRTVAGYEWFESYCALMDFYDVEVVVRDGYDSFKFGASRVHVSRFSVDAWFGIEGACFMVNVAVVPCRVPLLFSRPVLSGLGMRYDLAAHKVDLMNLGIHNLAMTVGTTGHPVLEVSRFPAEGPPRSPLKDFDDVGIPVARAYMTEVADLPLEASPKPPEPEIFCPKKIASEAYNLLTGKWDRGGHGFLAWWQGANQCRDFWIETGQEMIRIHVVPRKRAFDPKLWTTKYGHLKDKLLRRLGPVRETEAVPCLAAGTLVEKQSCLWSEEPEHEGLQHEARCLQRLGLWVGRSRFMKLEAAVTTVSGPSIRNVDADPGSLQPSEVTMEDGQGRDLDRARGVPSGGTREVDRPGVEGDPDRAKDRARSDTFDKYGSHYGVDEDDLGSAGDGGYLARPDAAGEAEPGKLLRDATNTADETVVPFGRYKGWYYKEVPDAYLQWAIQEIKGGNSHPDLVRLATWASERKLKEDAMPKKTTTGYDDIEVTAKHPPPKVMVSMERPGGYSSSDGSWEPVQKPLSKGYRRGRGSEAPAENMEQDIPAHAKEEMAVLEMQLATLRQKHGVAPKSMAKGPNKRG